MEKLQFPKLPRSKIWFYQFSTKFHHKKLVKIDKLLLNDLETFPANYSHLCVLKTHLTTYVSISLGTFCLKKHSLSRVPTGNSSLCRLVKHKHITATTTETDRLGKILTHSAGCWPRKGLKLKLLTQTCKYFRFIYK